MIGAVILQVILIALNAVFASAELAVVSMNDTKLEKMAEGGDKRAKRLQALTADSAKFLATIQVAITLAGFLGSAYAADNFAEPLVNGLLSLGLGIPRNILNSICVFLITVVISYFSIVFGELIPKRIAMQKKEELAMALSGPLIVVSRIAAPLVWLLTVSTNGVLRALGIDPDREEEVTEEEIRMMVAAGSEKGTIDEDENEMIQNIFEFDDTDVEEICTHRMDVDMVELDDPQEEWDKIIFETRHSFYPVCGENSDDIVGILSAAEYLRMNERTREKVMETCVKKPYYVPETMKADALFENMKKSGNYFAVVIDEYGGMTGIITLRDLIEVLVGELKEGREVLEPEDIRQIRDGEWIIQGSASLDDVAEELNLTLPVDTYDTFSGYICGAIEAIPEDGSSFETEIDGLKIYVNKVKDRKIEEASVTLLPPEPEAV